MLDFIGQAHCNFRFDLRYRALLGGTREQLKKQIEAGFPFLPAGCSLQLDRVSSERVLANLRDSLPSCPAAGGVTLPFLCLGFAEYVSHEGERPMAIRWRMKQEIRAAWLPVMALAV